MKALACVAETNAMEVMAQTSAACMEGHERSESTRRRYGRTGTVCVCVRARSGRAR